MYNPLTNQHEVLPVVERLAVMLEQTAAQLDYAKQLLSIATNRDLSEIAALLASPTLVLRVIQPSISTISHEDDRHVDRA